MIEINFNGKKIASEPGVTLDRFLRDQQIDRRVVIVERNGEILRDGALNHGDFINVYRISAGG